MFHYSMMDICFLFLRQNNNNNNNNNNMSYNSYKVN